MRTTVTLDDDLARRLKERAKERGVPFKQAINEAVRAGLAGGEAKPKRYRMTPSKMGVRPGIDLDKALQLADRLEDEEILRKLQQGR